MPAPLTVSARSGICLASVPTRTSISVLDMGALSLGVAAGGNVGFALDTRTEVRIRCSAERHIAMSRSLRPENLEETSLLVDHAIGVWRTLTEITSDFEVQVHAQSPSHIGLASSSALQSCVLAGLNAVCGEPLSLAELRELLISNYREVSGGRLCRGFTTGLSALLNLQGGFAVLSASSALLAQESAPDWAYVVAVPNQSSRGPSTASEELPTVKRGALLDQRAKDKKLQVISEDLIPAMRQGNLRRAGDAIRFLQEIGSKTGEIDVHGVRLRRIVQNLLDRRIACVFVTGPGPGIVMCGDLNDTKKMLSTSRAVGAVPILKGKLDNTGLVTSFA